MFVHSSSYSVQNWAWITSAYSRTTATDYSSFPTLYLSMKVVLLKIKAMLPFIFLSCPIARYVMFRGIFPQFQQRVGNYFSIILTIYSSLAGREHPECTSCAPVLHSHYCSEWHPVSLWYRQIWGHFCKFKLEKKWFKVK